MKNIRELKRVLDKPSKIVITTHLKPDADALGSSLGLAGYLKKKGHEVVVISPTDYPDFLNWMHGNDDVIIYEHHKQKISQELVEEADIIFCLDFNNLHRIEKLGGVVEESKALKVLIDHHLEPEDFADFEIWSTEAAATAELVYDMIVDLNEAHLVDENIAECLYAGLMTDTGSFKHPNTTPNVHRIAAALMEHGANAAKVSKLIYDSNSAERIKFLGFALSERLNILKHLSTAYFVISESDLKRFNSKNGDTEGLVNYALSIKGIVVAAVIIEKDSIIKMSFRSVGDFSVNEFARKYFNGGGHKNAAGGRSDLSLRDTEIKFLEAVELEKEAINQTEKINA